MKKKGGEPYHHGDLRNALLEAARAVLEKKGLPALSLREVARKAGVSHAAPYRHFKGHDALLAALALEGFTELRKEIAASAAAENLPADRLASLGGAYAKFVARQPALSRLMFGSSFPARHKFAELDEAASALGEELGKAMGDLALGIALWGAIHGLSMLALEDVVDLGQRRSGLNVLPSRVEILMRGLQSLPRI